jgi:hypothetical protein
VRRWTSQLLLHSRAGDTDVEHIDVLVEDVRAVKRAGCSEATGDATDDRLGANRRRRCLVSDRATDARCGFVPAAGPVQHGTAPLAAPNPQS